MKISADHIGKKFGKNWVLRDLNVKINSGEHYAITGSNGSGKSTFLKILAGFLTPTKGEIYHNDELVTLENFQDFCFTAPYIELPEEMTFEEFLTFHGKFRRRLYSEKEITTRANLPLKKRISEYSTGMKQRVQLVTAFYFKNNVIFMDEPTSNLDIQGFEWWRNEIQGLKDTTMVLASNQASEIDVCKKVITL